MENDFQIIFPADPIDGDCIHEYFRSEADVMRNHGILVGTKPYKYVTRLMYRGFAILSKDNYPHDNRFINTFQENENMHRMSLYLPYIHDLTVETYFVDTIEEVHYYLAEKLGWDRAFIKKDIKSLEHVSEGKSIWPNTTLKEMDELYREIGIEGKYAIRQLLDVSDIITEDRYWVFNDNIYHRLNVIPEIVKEATRRLSKLGSRYYTIDATPKIIIEVNPGESSDRYAVNSAEVFSSWIKKEFVCVE